MSESTNKTPSALSDTQDVYSSPYEEVNGCLCKVHITKQGINTDTGENTRTMRFGSKTKRVLLLRKDMVEKVMGI